MPPGPICMPPISPIIQRDFLPFQHELLPFQHELPFVLPFRSFLPCCPCLASSCPCLASNCPCLALVAGNHQSRIHRSILSYPSSSLLVGCKFLDQQQSCTSFLFQAQFLRNLLP